MKGPSTKKKKKKKKHHCHIKSQDNKLKSRDLKQTKNIIIKDKQL